jgi:hypothetical protein
MRLHHQASGAMAKVIEADDCEIEAGFIVQDGAFRTTVVVRTKAVDRRVREIGYVFAEKFNTESAAMKAARQYATIASVQAFQRAVDV